MGSAALSIGVILSVGCDKEKTAEKNSATEAPVSANPLAQTGEPEKVKEGEGLARALTQKDKLRLRIQKEPEKLLDAAVERRLYAERVEASSFLWVNFNRFQENYHPNYIMDGDPTTAWVEGADENGLGEWVRVRTSPISESTSLRLRIHNGYHKSEKLFKQNARAKEVQIKSLASGKTQTFPLEDNMEWQEINLALDKEKFEGFELKVVSDYPGTKYKDLCISDLEVFVTGRTAENPKFEAKKLSELKEWKSKRLSAAEIFKSKAGKELPIRSGYRVSKAVQVDSKEPLLDKLKTAVDGDEKLFARAQEGLESKFKGWKHYRVVVKNPVTVPDVDGLVTGYGDEPTWYWPHDQLVLPSVKGKSLLQARSISLFESKNDSFEAEEGDECSPGTVHGLRPPTEEGPNAKQLLVWRCVEEEERDGVYHYYTWELLQYDDDGWLRAFVNSSQAQYLTWKQDESGAMLLGGLRARVHGDTVAVLQSQEDQAAP
jgi:hypothetical protein